MRSESSLVFLSLLVQDVHKVPLVMVLPQLTQYFMREQNQLYLLNVYLLDHDANMWSKAQAF
jgi:hypothetical protein